MRKTDAAMPAPKDNDWAATARWPLSVTTLACIALVIAQPGAAEPLRKADTSPVVIELYTRAGCPHCARAERFLREVMVRQPGVILERRDVAADPAALARLHALVEASGAGQAAVPAIYVRGQLLIGFADEATTGRAIEALLGGAASDPEARVDAQAAAPRRMVRLPVFGDVDVKALGLPMFTLAIAAVDGFNPCAMWVLLFVLSMLVHLKSRARMALIGGTFVAVSGLVYFAFMAAWLNFFVLVGVSRALQVILGVLAIAMGSVHVKDFFAFKRGLSLSIPEASKRGIYRRVRGVLQAENVAGALVAVTILATMVNVVELLCTAGLPALYTQILTAQGVSPALRYAYLALYNAVYMLDDAALLTVAVVTLSQRKLQEQGGRVLKLVSGGVMAALGAVLILRPEWLQWSG